MANAYIGITHPQWLQRFRSQPAAIANFWRPSTKAFRAIKTGERFFCLVRGSPFNQRPFGAMGRLRDYRVLTVKEAWQAYGSAMGASSLSECTRRFELTVDQTMGHIVLDHFRVAETVVTASLFEQETGVTGTRYWQSGAAITEDHANWLEHQMFGGLALAAEAIGLITDRVIGNEEPGRREVVQELVYRDRAVVDQAKREQGTRCRICGFCFAEAYGNHGDGFIEVHHWPMLSKGGSDTNRNVVVVCANCHRMLHRSRDGMDWHELKKLVDAHRKTG